MRGNGWRALLVILVAFGSIGSTFGVARAVGVSDLQISVADMPDPVTDGAFIRYRLTIFNAGPNATPITVNFDLPSGGSIENISSSGMGSCTATETTGSCSSAGQLQAGRSTTIDVFVQAALPSPNALHASVTGPNPDPNGDNNDDTESTTVQATGDSVTGFIPPGGGSITTCGEGGPTSSDSTCATLSATGGPGGVATITEDPDGVMGCTLVQCLGSAADVTPPPGYTSSEFLTLNLDYDVSEIPTGDGAALVEKLRVDALVLRCIFGPNRVLPCLESRGRIGGDDYRFGIEMTSVDPKFQGFVL